MMIRLSALLTALLLTIGLSSPAQADIVTTTDANGLSYAADNANPAAGATVTDYDRNVGGPIVDIPATVPINGTNYAVTTIGFGAFFGVGLTDVTIPNSVTTIGGIAFGSNNLTDVTIPDHVTTIGGGAFGSNQLTDVNIGNSVIIIGADAFNSNQLTDVTIPNSVTTVSGAAFASNQLTDVTIGNSVTGVGPHAFNFNPALVAVRFLGPAPSVTANGQFAQSFDTSSGSLVLTYPGEFGVYTTPSWQGYNTRVFVPPTSQPTVTGASTASGLKGTVFTYTPTVTGNPAPTVTVTGGLPDGLALNSTTGEITGAPTESGSFPITLKASNGVGSDATLDVTITINEAANITGAATASGLKGTVFTYTPTVTGNPDPTVTIRGDLPEGLELSSTSGEITGKPTESGTFPITLKASNGVGSDATLDVAIIINDAANITGDATASGTKGDPFTYTPTVTGSPDPTVTVRGDLPDGLELSSTTGEITGKPTESGSFPFTLKASNGIGSDATLDVTITINDPVPGTFDPGPTATITGDARVGSTLTAGEGSPSPAPDSYTYQWLANGTAIGGATIKTFTLTPAQNKKTITVVATAVKAGYTDKSDTSAPTGPVGLAAKVLKLETSSSTYAGNSISVTIEKLSKNEPYTIRIDTIVVTTGTADPGGNVSTTVTVPLELAAGNHTITGTGAFADRFDTDPLKLKSPSDLEVGLKSSVKKAGTQNVVIKDLLKGENVQVRYDDTLISPPGAAGNSSGEYTLSFPVGTTVGTHTIKVTGTYDGRSTTKTFQVTN